MSLLEGRLASLLRSGRVVALAVLVVALGVVRGLQALGDGGYEPAEPLARFEVSEVARVELSRGEGDPLVLVRTEGGLLRAISFEGFDQRVSGSLNVSEIAPLRRPDVTTMCSNGRASRCVWINDELILANESGFQVFSTPQPVQDFRFRSRIELTGLGKCGLVFRYNRETLDGYFLSLDLVKGIAQLRDWGARHDMVGEHMMKFRPLQAGYWQTSDASVEISVMAFGSYLEISVNGRVILSLADKEYRSGHLGIYVESATLRLSDVSLEELATPTQSETHLVSG